MHAKPLNQKESSAHKVIDQDRRFLYLQRGIDRTPKGSQVYISPCAGYTVDGKNHVWRWSLTNEGIRAGQVIATACDKEDLYLFAAQHDWWIDDENFIKLFTNE